MYVARVGWQEARILASREPISRLLARPSVDPALQERLRLVLAARDFGRERLGMRVGELFTSFAHVDEERTVYVLSAARQDRLEAHTWWFPIVGRVPYRGFFSEEAARVAGRELTRRELDVDVRPAVAFSTLGWFADPLLSTTASAPPVALVEIVLHELFHATLYVPGASAFNESAATFAGHRGAIAFFCDGPGAEPGRCSLARARWAMERGRARVLDRLATRLRRLYAAAPTRSVRERTRTRLTAAAGAALERRRLGRRDELDPPNNARLLGELLYATDLDAFDALAPSDELLGAALRRLAAAVQGAADPLAVVRDLARAGGAQKLQIARRAVD